MNALIANRGTGDLKLAEAAVEVLWVAFNAGSSNSRCYLRNGSNATAGILWECVILKNETGHFTFNPAILATRGLFVDPDANCDSWFVCFKPAGSE